MTRGLSSTRVDSPSRKCLSAARVEEAPSCLFPRPAAAWNAKVPSEKIDLPKDTQKLYEEYLAARSRFLDAHRGNTP